MERLIVKKTLFKFVGCHDLIISSYSSSLSRLDSGYAMEDLICPKHGQCTQFESLHRRANIFFLRRFVFEHSWRLLFFIFFFFFFILFCVGDFFLLWMLCLYTNEAGLLPIPPPTHISCVIKRHFVNNTKYRLWQHYRKSNHKVIQDSKNSLYSSIFVNKKECVT